MLNKSMLVFAGLAAFAAAAPTAVRPPVPAGFTGGRAFNENVRNSLAPQKRSIDLDDYEVRACMTRTACLPPHPADIPLQRLVAEIPGYRRRYASLGRRDDHEDDEDCDDTPEPTNPGDDDDDCDSEDGDDDDDDEGNDDDCVEPDSDDEDDDDDCDEEPPVSGGGGGTPEPEPAGNSGSGDCKTQYTVKAGDNCSKVATDHSITLAQVRSFSRCVCHVLTTGVVLQVEPKPRRSVHEPGPREGLLCRNVNRPRFSASSRRFVLALP